MRAEIGRADEPADVSGVTVRAEEELSARPTESSTKPRDGLAGRIAFRLLATYFALYMLPSPLDTLPGADGLSEAVRKCWAVPVRWVAAHFFHIYRETLIADTGSGDTTFDYLLIIVMMALAIAITGAWTLRHEHLATRSHPRCSECGFGTPSRSRC